MARRRSSQRCSEEKGILLQNDRSILAALSLSLSSVVGQKASLPMRFDKRLIGAPSLSAHPHTLSKPFLLVVLVWSHDGSFDLTFSISLSCLLFVSCAIQKVRLLKN